MLKRVVLLCLFTVLYVAGYASADTAVNVQAPASHDHLRISLITCGMGNQIWQTFGHTAIRVIDSTKTNGDKDLIYNYGAYDGFDGSFFWTFATGKLVVFLGVVPFRDFLQEYIDEGRSVEEQVLLLNNEQKDHMLAYLNNNAEIEHRCYEYHIFFDNCSTRARDIFPALLGNDVVIADPLPKGFHLSYRTAFNIYYRNRYWERVGINICMGSTTDTVIANKMITFLPEFLSIAIDKSTLNGKPLAAEKTNILDDHINHASGINQPFIVMCLLALLTITGLSVRKYRRLGMVMSALVLVLSGLLSICVIIHWFYSEHVYGSANFNILWALPTNLFIGFFNFKGKHIYGLVSMWLIMVCLVLHVLKVQIMPLFELGPYLLALLCVYGDMYRQHLVKNNSLKL